MPRPAKPHAATLDQVDIARDGETAIIACRDGQTATRYLHLGPELANMTDRQVLDRFSEIIRVREAWAAEIGIIALLMAILLPALSRARAGALNIRLPRIPPVGHGHEHVRLVSGATARRGLAR